MTSNHIILHCSLLCYAMLCYAFLFYGIWILLSITYSLRCLFVCSISYQLFIRLYSDILVPSVYLSIYLCVFFCLSIYLCVCVCLSIYQSVYLMISLHVFSAIQYFMLRRCDHILLFPSVIFHANDIHFIFKLLTQKITSERGK